VARNSLEFSEADQLAALVQNRLLSYERPWKLLDPDNPDDFSVFPCFSEDQLAQLLSYEGVGRC
jgi:hypothetical protein